MNYSIVTDTDAWYLTPAPDDREHLRQLCESVIECAFFDALPSTVKVRPQVDIGPWRVDFLLGDSVVVECDGYAYHETPEAASRDKQRDRQLTMWGYNVLRFTGQKINKDVMKCVGDAIRTVGARDVG